MAKCHWSRRSAEYLKKNTGSECQTWFHKEKTSNYVYIYIDKLWKCWDRFCASIYFHLCETTKSESCWSFDRMLPSPFRTIRVLSYPFLGKGRLIRNLYYGILSAMVSADNPSHINSWKIIAVSMTSWWGYHNLHWFSQSLRSKLLFTHLPNLRCLAKIESIG